MKKCRFLLFVCLLYGAVACSKKQTNVACVDGTLKVHLVGFSSGDFNGAKITAAWRNQTGDTVVSFGTLDIQANPSGTDSFVVMIADPGGKTGAPSIYLPAIYDYKLLLPSLSRTYLIKNIALEGTIDSSTSCFDLISACDVNYQSTPVQSKDANAGVSDIYIAK